METIHVWERKEIALHAVGRYASPYREVEVWVDLEGPHFSKRVYGFWNGGDEFLVRIVAADPGRWRWRSGASVADAGLDSASGEFEAIGWNNVELETNQNRRGFLRPTPNGRGFQYADGTPFFLLGDTWWATPTFRYPWKDDLERPIGPEMSFQDMVRYRKSQGYNCIAVLAALPHWANDGAPREIRLDDAERTPVRAAWAHIATGSAKDMHNEGGRPFKFPGKVPGYETIVPDLDEINPEYFKYMDRKIDFLTDSGFVPFIETCRRDISAVWKKFHDWPESYARYIRYVFARYQAQNCLLSPIHFDYPGHAIPSRDFNEPANLVVDRYGHPPFGNLVGTNSSPSSLTNFGGPEEARWLTFHQTGNWREHEYYWYLTEIFNAYPPRPAFNGEPYYPGFPDDDPPAPSEEANLNFRSGMYGSFLSGGFAGYIYGAEGLWGGDIEAEAKYRMWDALKFESGDQVRHLKAFAEIEGLKRIDLIPDHELLVPNKAGPVNGYRGWAYCAHTPKKDLLLCYLEKGCPRVAMRGLLENAAYAFKWFNPRNGVWRGDHRENVIQVDQLGRAIIPPVTSDTDWGFALTLLRR